MASTSSSCTAAGTSAGAGAGTGAGASASAGAPSSTPWVTPTEERVTVPVTETANELTMDLDVVDPLGVVRLLRQTDAQIFAGWRDFPGLYDDRTLQALANVTDAAASVLRAAAAGKKAVIVMTGSGTSGRIAFMTARMLNGVAATASSGGAPPFAYLASGGDFALLMSDELPEDDPNAGAKELQHLAKDCDEVLFIGITCGVSAPYAMGQVDWAMSQPQCVLSGVGCSLLAACAWSSPTLCRVRCSITTVLMGFNPTWLGRDAPVEGWTKTCRGKCRCLCAGGSLFLTPPLPFAASTPHFQTWPWRWTTAPTKSGTLC